MRTVHFPKPFTHAHPPVVDINQIDSERLTAGQRAADRDRLEAHNDFEINRKAEEEVRVILDDLTAQDEALARIVEALAADSNRAGEECGRTAERAPPPD